jgi:hypothetical protein
VLDAVPLLGSISANAARLNALTTRIISIEEKADDIYNQGLKALFLANRNSDGKDGGQANDDALHRRLGTLRSSGKNRRSFRGCIFGRLIMISSTSVIRPINSVVSAWDLQ